MRVFITGATGFAGSHLVDQLLAAGHELFALVHEATSHQPLPQHPRLHAVAGDLLELASLQAALRQARPEIIFHLAGQASPALSWQNPALTVALNCGGTANILQAALTAGRPRVVVVTSAEIYGAVEAENLPLTESAIPQPRHPYGISKQAAGQLVGAYWRRYQLPAIEARPFNHIGPRQALGFVVPDFASQLAAIKLGWREPQITVGNLEARRDFTDVRDVAGAYQALAEAGRPGEAYLICSGKPVMIGDLLQGLIAIAGVSPQINEDPARMRAADIANLYGSHAKMTADTGWRPQIALETSLADALDDWLRRLQDGPPLI